MSLDPNQKSSDSKQQNSSGTNELIVFEDALEKCGFGIFQIKTVFLGFLMLLYVLNEIIGLSFLMPAAQCDLNLSSSDKGWLSAMVSLGIVTSSHLWGFLADTRGRRLIILISIFFAIIFSLATTVTSSFTLWIIFRYLVGFFIAGASTCSYPYIGEFFAIKNRAVVVTWISVSVGISAIYLPLVSWWMLSYEWSFYIGTLYVRPWRTLPFIYAVPGIIAFLWMLIQPESPKFLLTMGKDVEALKILQKIFLENNRKSQEEFSVKSLKPEVNEQYLLLKNSKGVKPVIESILNQTVPLIKPPHLRYFAACCFLQFATLAVGTGLGMWYPEIMNRVSASDSSSGINFCEALNSKNKQLNETLSETVNCSDFIDTNVWTNSIILGGIYTISFLSICATIKIVGRRIILIISLFSSGVAGIVLIYVTNPVLIIVLFVLFLNGCMINVSTINGAAVIVFPTYLRAMSVCISMLCGRLGGFLSTNFVGYFLDLSCEVTFYSFAILTLVAGFISFILPP